MFGLITELGNKISESANQIGDLFSDLLSNNRSYIEKYWLACSNKGLSLGKYRLRQEQASDHLLVIGSNASDKASRFLIPALLKLDKESVVIVDTKGMYQSTSGYLKSKGYQIKVLNLENTSQSLRFNPLTNTTYKNDYKSLAKIIVSNVKEITLEETLYICKKEDPERVDYIAQIEETEALRVKRNLQQSWTHRVKDASELLINVLLSVVKNYSTKAGEPERLHLGSIKLTLEYLRFLSRVPNSLDNINSFVKSNLEQAEELQFWQWFLDMAERHKEYHQVILMTSLLALNLWSDPTVVSLTTTVIDEFNIQNISKQPTAFYLIVSEDKIDQFAPLINLFLMNCFKQSLDLESKEKVHYFIGSFEIIKSFASFDEELAYPWFIQMLKKLGKRNCYVSLMINSLNEVEDFYQHSAFFDTFSNNFDYCLFLGNLSLSSILYIGKLFNIEQALIWEKVLAEELDQALVIRKPVFKGEEPTFIKMPAFFQNRKLKKLSEIAPNYFKSGTVIAHSNHQ